MNNDLAQFSEERLKKLIISAEGVTFPTFFELQANDTAALARIALSVKRSEVVAYMTYKGHLLHAADPKVLEHSDPQPLYDTPQPAHTEQDGWKLVPIEPTQEMVDAHMSGMQSAGFSRAYRDMLAAAPKPESE